MGVTISLWHTVEIKILSLKYLVFAQRIPLWLYLLFIFSFYQYLIGNLRNVILKQGGKFVLWKKLPYVVKTNCFQNLSVSDIMCSMMQSNWVKKGGKKIAFLKQFQKQQFHLRRFQHLFFYFDVILHQYYSWQQINVGVILKLISVPIFHIFC